MTNYESKPCANREGYASRVVSMLRRVSSLRPGTPPPGLARRGLPAALFCAYPIRVRFAPVCWRIG